MRLQRLLLGLIVGWSMTVGTAELGANPDTYSVQWENDRIANTDRHYTNGFRLS